MQKEWANKIVQMIPERLRATPVLKECIEELFDEVKTDFTASMKKSMGKWKNGEKAWKCGEFQYVMFKS